MCLYFYCLYSDGKDNRQHENEVMILLNDLQVPAASTMAASLSRTRSPSRRATSPCARARTRTAGWTSKAIPRPGPDSTTPPGWRPPPATCAASAATSASSRQKPPLPTSTTPSRASRAAAAAARPPSPAGDAKDRARRTVYQT